MRLWCVRSIGIDEELLLIDPESGRPLSVAGRVLSLAERSDAAQPNSGRRSGNQPGGTLGAELQQQQLETDTPPRTDLAVLENDLRRWRDLAVAAAGGGAGGGGGHLADARSPTAGPPVTL